MDPLRRQLINLMVFICCIHTAVFDGLVSQCRAGLASDYRQQEDRNQNKSTKFDKTKSNSSHCVPASIKKLFTWEKFSQKYNQVLITYYVIFLLEAFAIRLLSIPIMAQSPLGLLDCFLMPRVHTFGRAHKLGPPIIHILSGMFLIYRSFLRRSWRQLKFQVLEFLLHDYDQVLANELKDQVDQEHRRRSLAFEAYQEKKRQFSPTKKSYLTKIDNNGVNNKHESLQFIQNTFKFTHLHGVSHAGEQQQRQEVEWILRPNRTSKSWQQLANFTLVLFGISIYSIFSSILFVFATSVVPSITIMGFEITYPVCARWIQHEQGQQYLELAGRYLPGGQWNLNLINDSSLLISPAFDKYRAPIVQPISYSYILMTLNRTLACDIPIEQAPILMTPSDSSLVPLNNWYGLIRATLDIIVSLIFLVDFSLYFSSSCYLLFISSYDVILNAREISSRLDKFNKELFKCHYECSSVTTSLAPPPLYDRTLVSHEHELRPRPAESQRYAHLARETMAAQSMLMDHFKLVLDYNQFTSYFLFLMLVSLFLLLTSLATAVFTLRNAAIEFEFLIILFSSLMFVLYLLAGATSVQQANARIHSQLSTAMALDETSAETKMRWISLMKYYSPTPLYCFNLFNKIEISHLFCLKVSFIIESKSTSKDPHLSSEAHLKLMHIQISPH